MRRAWLVPLVLIAFALPFVAGAAGDERAFRADFVASASRGKALYHRHCESCHGARLRGDGSVAADLKLRPTDLTRIAVRHDGVFPVEELRQAIDGRRAVRGHGSRDMPVWGLSFQDLESDVNQEGAVRQDLIDLLAYVRKMQVNRAGPSEGGGARSGP